METSELGSLVGSAISTLAIVAGFAAQFEALVPVGAIALAASFSFYFQSRIQKSAREYERKRLQVTEVLGPVYGQVIYYTEKLENLEQNLGLGLTLDADKDEWSRIMHSYRIHLIDMAEGTRIDSFFAGLAALMESMNAAGMSLNRYEAATWKELYPNEGEQWGTQYVVVGELGTEHRGRVAEAVFWKKNPAEHWNMKFRDVLVASGHDSRGNVIYPSGDDPTSAFLKFSNIMSKLADEDKYVTEARDRFQSILESSKILQKELRSEIASWTEPPKIRSSVIQKPT